MMESSNQKLNQKGDQMREKKSFAETLAELEEIVNQLERGGVDLDKTLSMFEKGTELLKSCKVHLKEAEGKIKELSLDEIED